MQKWRWTGLENKNIDIPNYDEKDFLESSEPYSFLYQFKDDKFLMGQLKVRMRKKAANVGVYSFISLWNSYIESLQKKDYSSVENFTKFSGQKFELFSGPYICDDYGIAIVDKYGIEKNICRHPIIPIQRIINIDSGEERLKLSYRKGDEWREIIVEKSIIASSSSILQLSANGIMVNSENARDLSTYIMEIEQLNYDYIPEIKSISRLGWTSEAKFSPYVEDLYFDGENTFKNIFSSVRQNGSLTKWVDIMCDMRESKGLGRIFLAASFSSVLLEPCGLLPFFVHAWGGSGSGKTVGLMIAASVWASPKMGDYITSFNSTIVGQEMIASVLNNLPMCIDELQIQSSSGIKDFDRIIYQLSEGIGRSRGAKNGGIQKINTWKNCIITNGEHPISNHNSGGGAINRIIEFECNEKIYYDLIKMCDIINKNYGFAGKKFIEYLQKDGVMEDVIFIQKEFYRELLKYDSTEKQALSASAMLTADNIATSIIFQDDNGLQIQDIVGIMTKKDDIDQNKRAYNYILELVAKNYNKFRSELNDCIGEIWGKVENDKIYIIKSVFDKEMKNEGYNSSAFLSWAKRIGILETDEGKRTKKARIVGNPTNCICLNRKNMGF